MKKFFILFLFLWSVWVYFTYQKHNEPAIFSGIIVHKYESSRSGYKEISIIPDKNHTKGGNLTLPVSGVTYGLYQIGDKIKIKTTVEHLFNVSIEIFIMAFYFAVIIVSIIASLLNFIGVFEGDKEE